MQVEGLQLTQRTLASCLLRRRYLELTNTTILTSLHELSVMLYCECAALYCVQCVV